MSNQQERRGSRSWGLERSLSYSEAIRGSGSGRSSIEIPRMTDTEVYANEELKKQYRISQTYVEGKEITFPIDAVRFDDDEADDDSDSSEEERLTGLRMKIDVENNDSSKPSSPSIIVSNTSTRPMVSPVSEAIYERIEIDDSASNYNVAETNYSSSQGRSTPYSKRKRKQITHHRRRHGRPRRSRRVVFKDGEENVPVRSHIPAKSIKYLRDMVNTVINSKWRFLLLFMALTHLVFWLVFAGVWYAVTRSYQDDLGDGKEHCVTGTSSFAGLLLMTVETQMTIGYGVRYPNEECPEAIFVMILEIVAGTAMTGGLSSLLFTKLIRPNRHVSSVGFSKKATICLRDGEPVLQFRVWDLQNVHLIGSSVVAYMLKPIRTLEGEFVQNYMHQLRLQQSSALLLWPVTVVHAIDAASPLYDLSAENMMDYRFEIVVCLTGSSKNMSAVTQSRTSYLSKEIIWGYRFKNVINYSKKDKSYIIDIDNLNTVEQVDTPLCSAMHLKEFEENNRRTPSSPIDGSLPSTLSKYESLPSTPSFGRNGTQRSYGWNFRRGRLTAEDCERTVKGLEEHPLEERTE